MRMNPFACLRFIPNVALISQREDDKLEPDVSVKASRRLPAYLNRAQTCMTSSLQTTIGCLCSIAAILTALVAARICSLPDIRARIKTPRSVTSHQHCRTCFRAQMYINHATPILSPAQPFILPYTKLPICFTLPKGSATPVPGSTASSEDAKSYYCRPVGEVTQLQMVTPRQRLLKISHRIVARTNIAICIKTLAAWISTSVSTSGLTFSIHKRSRLTFETNRAGNG